jgi:hypothetical protein
MLKLKTLDPKISSAVPDPSGFRDARLTVPVCSLLPHSGVWYFAVADPIPLEFRRELTKRGVTGMKSHRARGGRSAQQNQAVESG